MEQLFEENSGFTMEDYEGFAAQFEAMDFEMLSAEMAAMEHYDMNNELGNDPVDLNETGLNRILGETYKVKREFEKKVVPESHIDSANWDSYKPLALHSFFHTKFMIKEESGLLFAFAKGEKFQVGIVKPGRETNTVVKVNGKNAVERADLYSEEVQGRGSGLNFSLYLHLIAVLILCRPSKFNSMAIFEPLQGHDLDVNGISIEVTGNNYKTRKTNTNWVINKYLLTSLCVPDIRIQNFIRWSRLEETNDTSMYVGSAFDMEDSPYTVYCNSFHSDIRELSDKQLGQISQCYAHWYSSKTAPTVDDEPLQDNNLKLLEDYMENCKQKGEKSVGYPSLLHCKSFGQDYSGKYNNVEPEWGLYENSTYSTNSVDFDYEPHLRKCHMVELTEYSYEDLLKSELSKYEIYESIVMEADLMSKIVGPRGYYYHEFYSVGICWNMKNKSSVTNSYFYYTFREKPENEQVYGRWEKIKNYWRSATLKTNRGYIEYAKVLPTKIYNMLMSMLVMRSKDVTTPEMVKACLTFALLCRGSNWHTTRLCGDMRFIVTTHFASSNRSRNLCANQLTHVKSFKSCDFILCLLYKKYLKSSPDYTKTPLFGLPIRYMSVEKDMSLSMYWHIRQNANHANDCMTKLIKAYKQEIEYRPSLLDFYKKQSDLLTRIKRFGCKQNDFDVLMNSAPKVSHLNIFQFICLTWMVKSDLQTTSSIQQNTGFSLQNMVSDHSSVYKSGEVYKSGKVVDKLTELIASRNCNGPMTLINSLITGDKITNETTIFEKDSKGGDREISANKIENSVNRMYRESLMITVSTSLPGDYLKEADKFTPLVKNTKKLLSSKNPHVISSEDRTFHCGNMHPELMSVAYLIIGKVCNINAMITASSSMRVNKHRDVVFPFNFTDTTMLEGVEHVMVNRMQSNVMKSVPRMRLYYHMQQGFEHVGAGVMNTITCSGFAKLTSSLYTDILDHFVFTTADDAIRGFEFKENSSAFDLTREAVYKPIEEFPGSMMINNSRKFVVSESMAEGNNIAITRNGMVSQAPIYSTLMAQPLTSTSPFADAMKIVSDAKSCIFWGMSPNLSLGCIRSSYDTYRRKWLVDEEQMDVLADKGLFPKTVQELLSPCYKKQLVNAMINCCSDKLKASILNREMPLHTGIVREFNVKTVKDESEFTINSVGMFGLDFKADQVIKSRMTQNRINPCNARPLPVAKRVATFKCMYKFLCKEQQDNEYETVNPEVNVIIRPMEKRDMEPSAMGSSYNLTKPRLGSVKCFRFLSCVYRDELTTDEYEMSQLSVEEFKKAVKIEYEKESVMGLSFTSPSGLPLVLYDDTTLYLKPHCMNFHYNFKEEFSEKPRNKVFMYRNVEVDDVELCHWGRGSLEVVNNNIIGFCTGYIDGQKYGFYKTQKSDVQALKLTGKDPMEFIRDGAKTIVFLNKVDWSPIDFDLLDTAFQPSNALVTGDNIACGNYGDYLRTNTNGFDIYRQLYKKYNSDIPYLMKRYAKQYPQFHPEAIEISDGMFYTIVGSDNIANLKLVSFGVQRLKIDVDAETPVIIRTAAKAKFV